MPLHFSVELMILSSMLTSRRLKRLFQGILVASFVPGCGGIDREQFTANACAGTTVLDGVTPASPVDFMEYRQTFSFTDPPMFDVLASQGVACSKASGSACSDALAALPVSAGWKMGSNGFSEPATRSLVFTRGDDVGHLTTVAALKTFLAPVENARDAMFLINNELADHNVICDELNVVEVSDGFDVLTTSGSACGEGSHRDENIVHVSSTGEVTVTESVIVENGDPGCAIGRRPEGLIPSQSSRQTRGVGTFFADAARLEAASVFAFERLEAELRGYRAPRTLVRDARRARNDEVRHARMTRRIAKKNGAIPAAVRVRRPSDRSWIDFVKENAIEGCIRETFGALVATYQAKHATDEHIKAAMRVIAEDETRHASLAWRVAKWAEDKLSAEQIAEVRALQIAEVRRMACSLSTEDSPMAAAGLPGRNESLRMLAGFSAAIGLARG
jgi:hypothetical protein